MVLALVVAACQPAATPTPTARPTQPPTEVEEVEEVETEAAEVEEVETEAAEEVATEEAMATEEEMAATEEMVATEEEMAATEEVAMVEEEPTEAVEEPTEVAMEPTAAATEEMVVEEPTEAATEEMVVEEPTEVATEEMVVEEPTEVATEEMVVEEPTEVATEEMVAEEPTEEAMVTEVPMVEETSGNVVVVSPEESVVVGLAAALSGEGVAPLGVDIQRGAEIAVARRSTVTVDGVTFNVTLDSQDDLCSAEGGQAVANRFVSNSEIAAVVGPMCSSACRAASPIFDAAGFTTLSPSCTAADLSTSGSTSFNRTVVSDAFQGRIAADFIYTVLGVERIATIHDGSPYGEGLVAVLTARFTELGGEVVAADAVNVGDTDFRGLLEDIAQEDPELIYFGGFPAEAARLIVQRADANLEDVVFMGADGILGTEVIELAGAAADGTYASASIPAVSDQVDAFLAEYAETYGEEPPAPYHAHAYDGVNIILNGIEAVGTVDADGNLVIDRDALSQYVRSFTDYEGLTGVLSADGTGETSFTDIGISQVEDGAFVRIYIGRVVDGETVLEAVTVEAPMEEVATEEAAEEEVATEEAPAEEMVEPTAEATEAS
jgi:branched-chain amino acid transport system substrate-binding protein